MSEWIEWRGGEQPVADDVVVEVVLRYESIEEHDPAPFVAAGFSWGHNGSGNDIIAYRIVSQDFELDRLRNELEALKADIETYVHISSEQATENESLRKENAALREALDLSIAAMEAYEEKVDREWGTGRSISEIEFDGDLPHCIGFARAALQGAKDD